MKEQLQNLALTEKDFDMMVEGLEELPNKGAAGDMLVDLFSSAMLDDGPEKDKFKKEREAENKKAERKKELVKENVRVLQGKLITMKRLLIDNKLMEQANDAITD